MALPKSVLAALASMPELLEATYRAVPQEFRTWRPAAWDGIPGERFSAVGQLCHVRDIEILGYHVRIARLLAEDAPSLVSIDGYELEVQKSYDSTDPEEALRDVRSARASTLELLRDLTNEQLERRGTFAEYGELSLRSLIHYLSSHDRQHLACMDWLLGKIHSERSTKR